jgi:hypothetical protein
MKKKSPTPSAPAAGRPGDDEIREYAIHLYRESGCVPGRDEDNWLEAEVCLIEEIPKEQAHKRLHHHLKHRAKAAAHA